MSFITAFELSKLFCMTTGNIRSLKHSTTQLASPTLASCHLPAGMQQSILMQRRQLITELFVPLSELLRKVTGVLIKCEKKIHRRIYPEAQF